MRCALLVLFLWTSLVGVAWAATPTPDCAGLADLQRAECLRHAEQRAKAKAEVDRASKPVDIVPPVRGPSAAPEACKRPSGRFVREDEWVNYGKCLDRANAALEQERAKGDARLRREGQRQERQEIEERQERDRDERSRWRDLTPGEPRREPRKVESYPPGGARK